MALFNAYRYVLHFLLILVSAVSVMGQIIKRQEKSLAVPKLDLSVSLLFCLEFRLRSPWHWSAVWIEMQPLFSLKTLGKFGEYFP